MNLKSLDFTVDLKSVTTQNDSFEWSGYVAGYGNVDSYGDVIVKGAFAKTIGKTVPAMFEHSTIVGKMKAIREDEYGLAVEGKMLPKDAQNPRVGDVSAMLRWMMSNDDKFGSIDYKMSVGVRVIKSSNGEMGGQKVKFLEELELVEGSVVMFPANENAIITNFKSDSFLAVSDIEKMSERELEAAFKSGVKMSDNLAKSVISKIKSQKNSAIDWDLIAKAINRS